MRLVELGGGYDPVLVLIVQIKGVADLGSGGGRAAEGEELVDVDEAVAIGVDLLQDVTELELRVRSPHGFEILSDNEIV